MTVGAVNLIGASWSSAALLGWTIGLPVGVMLISCSRGGASIAKSMGGKPADPTLTRYAQEAAEAVGVSPPEAVYEVPANEPNAFAASNLFSSSTTVAVTSGLRSALTTDELKAVLAHEMGHLQYHDVVRNMHVATAVAGFSGIYQTGRMLMRVDDRKTSRSDKNNKKGKDDSGGTATAGLALMGAGMAAEGVAHLVRLAASRNAEIRADRAAAKAFGADTMISALRKIERSASRQPADLRASRSGRAFAFAMISDGASEPAGRDVSGKKGGLSPQTAKKKAQRSLWQTVTGALRTHPPMDERIAALEQATAAGVVPAANPKARSSWY